MKFLWWLVPCLFSGAALSAETFEFQVSLDGKPVGTHRYSLTETAEGLRVVSEAAIARYQNVRGQQHVVCPAGTVLILHHGIWHGGGVNRSDRLRYMFKIRLCPTEPQVRLYRWEGR